MRQRLAFERVLLPAPRVLLLDEPFTGLDDDSAQRMLARLASERDGGTLVVLATHDLLLVDSLVDRACLVKDGVLVPLERSRRLAESYRAAMNDTTAGRTAVAGAGAPRPPAPREWPVPVASDTAISDIARAAWVLLAKDLRIEWRSREGLLTTAFFALACVLVFSFGLVRDGTPVPDAGPAVLWVTVALAGTLAMARTFERERAAGTLTAVLASAAPRPALYLGKWGALMVLMVSVELVLLPLVALFFQMPLERRPLPVLGAADCRNRRVRRGRDAVCGHARADAHAATCCCRCCSIR